MLEFESARNGLIQGDMVKGKMTFKCNVKKGKNPCLVCNPSGRCVAKQRENGEKVILEYMSDWRGHGDSKGDVCEELKDTKKKKKKKSKKKKKKKSKSKKKNKQNKKKKKKKKKKKEVQDKT